MNIHWNFGIASLFFHIYIVSCESDLTRLRRTLLTNYDVNLRPVLDENETTTVKLAYYVQHLLHMEEESETLCTQGTIVVTWTDRHLTWNPKDYNNLTSINFGDHEIWQPDVYLFYSASHNSIDQGRDTFVTVMNDGKVVWDPEANYEVPCYTDYKYFPYDQHRCEFEFGSWSHDGDTLHLTVRDGFKLFPERLSGSEWKLVSYFYNISSYYMGAKYPYNTINLTLTIQRTSSLYKMTSAIPVLASAIFTLSGFWMELHSTSRYLIGMTNFVMMSLHLLNLGSTVPGGRTIPLIVQFSATALCLSVGFLVVTVLLDSTKRRRGPPPELLVRFFRKLPENLFCLEINHETGALADDSNKTKQEADWRLVCVVFDRFAFWTFGVVYVIVTSMLFAL